MLYPLQERLGLPKRTPHKARHTCATLLAREGVAPLLIQQILGHSDYAFTANVYTHKDYSSLLAAINAIWFYIIFSEKIRQIIFSQNCVNLLDFC